MQNEKALLKVGDLAKAVQKTVRAIHLYEELGLLVPVSRSSGGYRLYTEDAVKRVNWIVRLQEMGLSLTEIQNLLREWEAAPNGSTGMSVVRAMFEQKLAETRETIKKLQALEAELKDSLEYLASCNTCEPNHVQSECKQCGYHGHVPSEAPQLVAGLAGKKLPVPTAYDVPLSELLGEGNR
jgi:MerR family transcriptional regulator, copper efflux regulator